MSVRETKGDIFKADYHFIAHCISADFKLGAGIAEEINERFATRAALVDWKYATSESAKLSPQELVGRVVVTNQIINLITKERYFMKPTLSDLDTALKDLYEWIINNPYYRFLDSKHPMKIAMLRIGCGLDKLKWDDVNRSIRDVFEKDKHIEVTIYTLNN